MADRENCWSKLMRTTFRGFDIVACKVIQNIFNQKLKYDNDCRSHENNFWLILMIHSQTSHTIGSKS